MSLLRDRYHEVGFDQFVYDKWLAREYTPTFL